MRHFWVAVVCALNGKYSSLNMKNPGEWKSLNAGVTSRSLVSRKVVYRKVSTKVSETANVCTDEQKLDKRHQGEDEIAQHIKVRSLQDHLDVDSAGVNRRVFVLPREIFTITRWLGEEVSRPCTP